MLAKLTYLLRDYKLITIQSTPEIFQIVALFCLFVVNSAMSFLAFGRNLDYYIYNKWTVGLVFYCSLSISTFRPVSTAGWPEYQHQKHNIALLSEQNLVSPFLVFFSFWHNLKIPVALYIVCNFHYEWTKRNLLENTQF